MAFRIHESVVRGEVDNRVKGIVRGKIWLSGRPDPITLDLKGNACPDLAGCLLTFSNPKPLSLDDLSCLNAMQSGHIGDLTSSRKVRVFDIPLAEAMEMYRRKEKPPEHMANCLYLEWYSEFNGRVVIESVDYQLTISAPEWRMTAEDEKERETDSAVGMADFMNKLSDAIEVHQEGQKDPEEEWDEHDYEKFLKESDARAEKYAELLDKYGDSDEAEAKIAEEMGWTREMTEEEAEEERRRIEEINAACEEALNEPPPEPDPIREGIDWIRTEDGEIAHPLQHRCAESAMKFWREAGGLDSEESDAPKDNDLIQFVSEFQITAAKLAGALGSIADGHAPLDGAFTVAYLKRALDHLHKAQAGLEAAAPKKLLSAAVVKEARKELFEIREGILKLMDEYRKRED